jgi:2-polyprenyl-3-methyl-5-hydroxy-6-metoxy-1,4-benzoquinol methylase
MIDVMKEVEAYLGNIGPNLARDGRREFKQFDPQSPRETEMFYKYSHSCLKENAKHPVPDEVKDWKGWVLDFGGGAGNVSIYLAEKGSHVDYIDLNYMQQDFIQWVSELYGLKIEVISKPDKDYDYIILRDVVEHLEDYPSVLKELFDCASKGTLVFSKPEFCGPHAKQEQRFHFADFYDYEAFMQRQGLEKIDTYVWRKK